MSTQNWTIYTFQKKLKKNSLLSVKHGKLKKVDMDHKEDSGSVRQFSSKAKASKAKSTNSN